MGPSLFSWGSWEKPRHDDTRRSHVLGQFPQGRPTPNLYQITTPSTSHPNSSSALDGPQRPWGGEIDRRGVKSERNTSLENGLEIRVQRTRFLRLVVQGTSRKPEAALTPRSPRRSGRCFRLVPSSFSPRWQHLLRLDTIPQVGSGIATWLPTRHRELGMRQPVSSNGPLFRRDNSLCPRAARRNSRRNTGL